MPKVLYTEGYDYSSSGISRRTGLSRQEVQQLRNEAKREVKDREGGRGNKVKKKIGDKVKERVGRKVPKVEYGKDGLSVQGPGGIGVSGVGNRSGGSISFPGGMRVEVVNKGCYQVKLFYIFGRYAYSNIQKQRGCEPPGGNGNDEDYPPHCTNPKTGNKGKGGAIGLYPECLRGTGIKVGFWILIVAGYENYGENPNGDTILVKSIGEASDFDFENDSYTRKQFYSVTHQDGQEDILTDNTATRTITGDIWRTFVGTLEELEAYLASQPYLPYGESVPGGKNETWEDGRVIGSDSYQSGRLDSYVYPVVFTPTAEFSHCNPTGNEGCDIEGFSDTGLKRPKSGGGLKSGGKGDGGGGETDRDMADCCRKTSKLLKELHQVLAVEEMLKEGLEVPNKWIIAGGKKTSKLENYLMIAEWQMRMQDHLGIHPFKAKVTDANAAQSGDQSIQAEFVNATAAAKQISELLLENKKDSSTRLNLMVRIAVAVGQILNAVSIVAKTLEGIVQFLGMPIREKNFKVKMPFDFSFGGRRNTRGKGFGKVGSGTQKGIDALDINTEAATEALLPKFMQDEEQPIRVEVFDDRQSDLIDIITKK